MLFSLSKKAEKLCYIPHLRKTHVYKILHLSFFWKEIQCCYNISKNSSGEEKDSAWTNFFYVDRNYVYSRQPSFLLLWKRPNTAHKKLQGFFGSKVTRQNSRALPHVLNHCQRLQKTLILTELLVCKPSQFLGRLPTLIHDYKRRNSSFHLISTELAAAAGRRLRACSQLPTLQAERPRWPLSEAGSL